MSIRASSERSRTPGVRAAAADGLYRLCVRASSGPGTPGPALRLGLRASGGAARERRRCSEQRHCERLECLTA
jgi:hypothetical protein